ncbi:uncharacterized protein LOC125375961 [Haliotis rufescens]|uniref:uncharacterized protein LOC125375961 n=1 Tax=Haliotis rufescens TaxID=6454 RepID=UPI00201ED834|nr:uncharacterized protein LOC125375961 [Haliotis rufescens]
MGYETHVVFWYGLVMHFYTHVVHGEQQEITFDANKEIIIFAKPSDGTNETVATGLNITFVCRTEALDVVNVEWYRNYERNKTADVEFFNNKCQLRMQTLPGLYVQQTDCKNGQFTLRIRHVDIRYEADWFCVVLIGKKRHQSQFVALHVQNISVGNGEEITDSTPQLIGAAASGALVLLAVVATVVGLLRSRRARNTANAGPKSKQSEQDQGSYESVVMEDNPIYSSHDEKNSVNAHPPALSVRSDASCDHVPIF